MGNTGAKGWPTRRLVRRFVIALLIAIFSAGLIANVYIHLSYWSNMPRIPDPASGRILHLTVNHGTLVYVTRQELDRAQLVFGLGSYVTIVVGLLLAFVRVYWDDPSTISENRSETPRAPAPGS